MKPFGEWVVQPVKPEKEAAQEEIDNPYDLDLDTDDPTYPCRVCEKDHSINCDVADFDPDMHYCGGSPSCCP